MLRSAAATRCLCSTAPVMTSSRCLLSNRPVETRIKLSEFLRDANADKNTATASKTRYDHLTQTELKYYDPPYLERAAPFPNYPLLNINLKGYDFSTLDVYYEFVARLCKSLKVQVVEVYRMPARSLKIKTLQPFSNTTDKEYSLQVYHRVVRVRQLRSTLAPLLFESIQMNLPEGVQMNVSVPTQEEDEFRYVPDIELNELKQKLEDMSKKPKDEAATTTPASTTSAKK